MLTKGKVVPIGVILALILVGLFIFLNHSTESVSAKNSSESNTEELKDNLIMDIFALEILKAIRQHYKMDADSALGYGVEQFKVIERQDSKLMGYYVLIDVEANHQKPDANKLNTLGKDTIKFAVGFDDGTQIKLKGYHHNAWK